MSRIVMIVDNGVRGDSRVIKTATSAAAAGHDVIVLGRRMSPDLPDEFDLDGGAQVRLIPSSLTLLSSVTRSPRRSIRYPLAYPSRDIDTARGLRLTARKRLLRELRERRAQLGDVPRWRLAVMRARVDASRGWHALRNRQLKGASEMRSRGSGPVQQLNARARLALDPDFGWQSLDPVLADFELAYGPEIDALEPDLIHAHDFRMIGVGVRAVHRARQLGRECAVVYDAHEFLPGIRRRTPVWHAANEAYESAYIRRVDRVVTVSDELARMLAERHRLPQAPAVVLNAPEAHSSLPPGQQSIREAADVPEGAPLVAYHGSPARQRGLATVVEAMASLPGYHAAFVLPKAEESAPYLDELLDAHGVRERVHFLPYVPHDQVVGFLRSADLGIIPIEHDLNHEIALITKFFDYAHAGLPIVVSDVRAMSTAVREHGIGTVFAATDAADCARAIEAAFSQRQQLAAAYTPDVLASWTWEAQVPTLLATYREAAPWLT